MQVQAWKDLGALKPTSYRQSGIQMIFRETELWSKERAIDFRYIAARSAKC
jgi:hypothetical protein